MNGHPVRLSESAIDAPNKAVDTLAFLDVFRHAAAGGGGYLNHGDVAPNSRIAVKHRFKGSESLWDSL